MKSSLFNIPIQELDIANIISFCDQKIPEGLRVEYKKDFPKNLKLVETICAFANTQGGILLVGVKADKKKNIPKDIPGVELKEGLEEKIINLCLSHISPTFSPEIKICSFKSDSTKNEDDRGVLFIRVKTSYTAPHYLVSNNEIRVRVHNENALADLSTIEHLIEKRESIASNGSGSYSFYDKREVEIDSMAYETVVIAPKFQSESFINFYTQENSDFILKTANETIKLYKLTVEPWKLVFTGRNSTNQITRYFGINKLGSMSFHKTATTQRTEYYALQSIKFIEQAIKSATKIYSHFGFFGDLILGLTLDISKNLSLILSDYKLYEKYEYKNNSIRISRNLSYDDLSNPQKILQEILQELIAYFGLILPEKDVIQLIAKTIQTA